MSAPESGFSTQVEYVRAVDGDTVEVELRRRFHVRIRDIDAVELKSPTGISAKTFVAMTLMAAKELKIFVPTNDTLKLMDINSFNRIVADLYVDGKSLAEIIREAGYEKNKK